MYDLCSSMGDLLVGIVSTGDSRFYTPTGTIYIFIVRVHKHRRLKSRMYVDNAVVAVLGLMGLVSLLNWGFILISDINILIMVVHLLKTTGMAYSMTGVEDDSFTSSVSEQNNDDKGESEDACEKENESFKRQTK